MTFYIVLKILDLYFLVMYVYILIQPEVMFFTSIMHEIGRSTVPIFSSAQTGRLRYCTYVRMYGRFKTLTTL